MTACDWCDGTGIVQDRRTCWQKAHRFTWVYIMFNAAGECLYVGMTSGRYERWKAHQRMNPHITEVAVHFRMIGPFTRKVARRVEIEQQLLRRPRYNKIRQLVAERAEQSA